MALQDFKDQTSHPAGLNLSLLVVSWLFLMVAGAGCVLWVIVAMPLR